MNLHYSGDAVGSETSMYEIQCEAEFNDLTPAE